MHRGYVKNWRKGIDSPLFRKPLTWHFWQYCLMKATHKELTTFVNGELTLEPGQFVFGRKKAALESGLTEQNIRTAIKHLKSTNQITIHATKCFSVITVCNWEIYQGAEAPANQQPNQQPNQEPTNNQPRSNQQPTTDKNVKNNKNEEEVGEFTFVPPSTSTPTTAGVINALRKLIMDRDSIDKAIDSQWMRFARNDVNRMFHQGYTEERLIAAIDWLGTNDFWVPIDTVQKLSKHMAEIEHKAAKESTTVQDFPLPSVPIGE